MKTIQEMLADYMRETGTEAINADFECGFHAGANTALFESQKYQPTAQDLRACATETINRSMAILSGTEPGSPRN